MVDPVLRRLAFRRGLRNPILVWFLKLGVLRQGGAVHPVLHVVRWTIPRFRFDQLMGLAWKVLIPLSIVNLMCVMVVKEYGASKWWLTVLSIGVFFGAAVIGSREKRGIYGTRAVSMAVK